MSYNTHYRLVVEPESLKQKVLDSIEEYDPDGIRRLESGGEGSWWDHEVPLKYASATVPGTLIILTGQGEEIGDCWRKFFRKGKVEIHNWKPPEKPSEV